MGLELFIDLRSQPSRAVYIFARKNRIPFQMRTVDIFKGQHVSEEFSQVNCLQKLPVLKDGNFVLTERKVLGPLIGIQIPEEKMERNRNSMVLSLQHMEDKFLWDRNFLAGQQVTLADLMSLEELIQPVAFGYNLFEGRP